MNNHKELIMNNSKAFYNGYLNSLTVEWMASMAGVSKSKIYTDIKRYKNHISNLKEVIL